MKTPKTYRRLTFDVRFSVFRAFPFPASVGFPERSERERNQILPQGLARKQKTARQPNQFNCQIMPNLGGNLNGNRNRNRNSHGQYSALYQYLWPQLFCMTRRRLKNGRKKILQNWETERLHWLIDHRAMFLISFFFRLHFGFERALVLEFFLFNFCRSIFITLPVCDIFFLTVRYNLLIDK